MSNSHQNDPRLGETPLDQTQHERLCAYVFGELEGSERVAFEAELSNSPVLQAERDKLESTLGLVHAALPAEELSDEVRATLRAAAERGPESPPAFRFLRGGGSWAGSLAAAALLLAGGTIAIRALRPAGVKIHPGVDEQARVDPNLQALRASRPDTRLRSEDAEPKVLDELVTNVEQALEESAPEEEGAGGLLGEKRKNDSRLGLERAKLGTELKKEQEFSNTPSSGRVVAGGELALFDDAADVDANVEGMDEFLRDQQALMDQKALLARARATEAEEDSASPFLSAPASNSDGSVAVAGQRGSYRGAGDTRPGGTAGATSAPSPGVNPAGPASPGPSSPGAPLPSTTLSPPAEAVEDADGSDEWFLGKGAVSDSPAAEAAPKDRYAFYASEEAARQLQAIGYAGGEETVVRDTLKALEELGYSGDDGESTDEALELLRGLGYTGGDAESVASEEPVRFTEPRRRGARRAVPTPGQVLALANEQIVACGVLPNETPADMFFRRWGDNPFVRSAEDPLSTFSIDVDTASYTLARRTLQAGQFPVPGQIRTEEFLNYFAADQPAPDDGATFAIGVETAPSLFHGDPGVDMLRVTVRGKDVHEVDRQPLALTFVVDNSGSMEGERLGMVKAALGYLLGQLSANDSIALVKFHNEAYVLSPMISAANRGPLEDSLAMLGIEGGTNVEAGLIAGYEVAAASLTPGAVNRVVLLSDGVGNIGETDQTRLLDTVAEYRAKGIYLNTFGVGMGDHNDHFLEQLADRGDGLCHYIDSESEARRVFEEQLTKTLQPIARDVKIQVEFDPTQVEHYRQVGYENRKIADADFRNDAIDAGEVNAGHQVTALYEVVRRPGAAPKGALATVRVRFKPPFAVDAGELSESAKREVEVASEIQRTVRAEDVLPSFASASVGYRRAVLVAQFAELLRESVHARGDSLDVLLAETRSVEAELATPETTEFLVLLELALPILRERETAERDELEALYDELSRLNYELAVREQTGEKGTEEPDEELRARIAAVEEAVRAELRERFFGIFDPADTDPAARLEALGYTGDER